jgi:predicted CXXCH cytochrome family protein
VPILSAARASHQCFDRDVGSTRKTLQNEGMNSSRLVTGLLLVSAALVAGLWLVNRQASSTRSEQPVARFVGSATCATCHQPQHAAWLASKHRHAMEAADTVSVRGDFSDAELRYFGRKTRFFKEGDAYRITTENEQGQPQTFTIAYTLGYEPLQQYLVDTGGGRLQALPFAWDTRDKKEGGQRWFHLYPDENVTPANSLFWTRPLQNWNHMCGDCHTTGFSKNFSDDRNVFESRWSEIGNGCESCHGAGSAHVDARRTTPATVDSQVHGLRNQTEQINQCGVCHSRRVRLREPSPHERGLDVMLQTWRPQLPQEGLYFADGQIRDEVFEIGSFLQSKMSVKGVTCTDCHDPHSSRLKAEGNALCTRCHLTETFDRTEHHFHEAGTAGAQCVSCHMPERTYMVIDPRRDHRFAVPRPDLSDRLGTPNACIGCHTNRTNAWAAEALRNRTDRNRQSHPPAETWGTLAFEAAREKRSGAAILNALSAVPSAAASAPISRGAVLGSIRALTPDALSALAAQQSAPDALIRLGAVQAAATVPQPQRAQLLLGLLRDPTLAVRMEAASLLAATDRTLLSPEQRASLDAALGEYRAGLQRDADRAEALAGLAALQAAEGDVAAARASFAKALQRDDMSLTMLLNYADFHRSNGDDAAAEPVLMRAITLYPDAAAARYALGLLRVRQQRLPDAVRELEKAVHLSPDDSRYAYVYAVSLYTTGQKGAALALLDDARRRFPANAEIPAAIEAYCAENRGDRNPEIAAVCSAPASGR